MKLFGLGIKEYVRDKMNVFDCLIVICSLVEVFLSSSSGISNFRSLRLLRALRVLRVARLIRSMAYIRLIVSVLVNSLESFMYLFLILMLYNFIYALVGMQIYAQKF
jgi:hypothetical protein